MTMFDESDGLERHPVAAADHAVVMGPDEPNNPLFTAGQWLAGWDHRHEDPDWVREWTDPARLEYWGDFEWCALLLEGWTGTSVLIRSEDPNHVRVALLRRIGSGPQRVEGPSELSEMRLLTMARQPGGAWLAWSLEPWSGYVDGPLEVIGTEYPFQID